MQTLAPTTDTNAAQTRGIAPTAPVFNPKAASLHMAAAVAAVAPTVNGYFRLAVEMGNGVLALVAAQSNHGVVTVWGDRVWTLDDDGNEIDLPFAELDTDLIEETANR